MITITGGWGEKFIYVGNNECAEPVWSNAFDRISQMNDLSYTETCASPVYHFYCKGEKKERMLETFTWDT